MSTLSARADMSADELAAVWRGQRRWWHIGCALILAAALLVVLLDEPGPHGRLPTALLIIGMGVAYALFGVRAIAREEIRYAVAYQVCAWACLLAIVVLDPGFESWLLFFCLFPQIWATFGRRAALAATGLALGALMVATLATSDHPRDDLPAVLISVVISFALSAALGLFIHRIIAEAEARAAAIDELRSTRAQLAAVERAQGIEDERSRLSREIHDTLAQGFTSVIALTRAASAALDRGDADAARERLALIEATAVDNLAEARVIVAELTPGHLQSRTLGEALTRLAESVSRETGIQVSSDVTGEAVPLGGAAEVVLLRAAQEGLSNVRRHSGAKEASVTLSYAAERVAVTVSDNGSGFDPHVSGVGYGLDGLRARAAELGGSATVSRHEPRGTQLTLELPR